jgi:hypothetical protein
VLPHGPSRTRDHQPFRGRCAVVVASGGPIAQASGDWMAEGLRCEGCGAQQSCILHLYGGGPALPSYRTCSVNTLMSRRKSWLLQITRLVKFFKPCGSAWAPRWSLPHASVRRTHTPWHSAVNAAVRAGRCALLAVNTGTHSPSRRKRHHSEHSSRTLAIPDRPTSTCWITSYITTQLGCCVTTYSS